MSWEVVVVLGLFIFISIIYTMYDKHKGNKTLEQEIAELKATLVKFMNDRLQVELDKLWDEGVLSDEKLASYRNEHFRTSY